MKNKFLCLVGAAIFLLSCGTTSYTSTSANTAYSTPTDLQASFSTQYPNATNIIWRAYDEASVPIDWELSGWSPIDARGHVVTFNLDEQEYYAWYDANGNWIGSTHTVKDLAKLPEAVQSLIRDKYGNYTLEKVDQEMWKDQVAYEVKLKGENKKIKLLVDREGNVLKEKIKPD